MGTSDLFVSQLWIIWKGFTVSLSGKSDCMLPSETWIQFLSTKNPKTQVPYFLKLAFSAVPLANNNKTIFKSQLLKKSQRGFSV